MKCLRCAASILGLTSCVFVYGDTFGSGANQFEMGFVEVGNALNSADGTGYGSVGYNYRMGTYEVSRGMIESYNAIGGGPTIGLSSMTNFGGNGLDRPATGISWNEAARFVNWLNTSNGYGEAYKFTSGDITGDISLWTSGESGYNASNPYRNSNAYYFLPSEDEWYKAAYYDPAANGGAGAYWDYATGSNSAPTAVTGGISSGTAVYGQAGTAGPSDVGFAGGLSPLGTMGQNGNVYEWTESAFDGVNDSGNEIRSMRGGYWANASGDLNSSFRLDFETNSSIVVLGFRVASASVPEPSVMALTAAGIAGLILRRRRNGIDR